MKHYLSPSISLLLTSTVEHIPRQRNAGFVIATATGSIFHAHLSCTRSLRHERLDIVSTHLCSLIAQIVKSTLLQIIIWREYTRQEIALIACDRS